MIYIYFLIHPCFYVSAKSTKPMSWYRERAPLKWSFSEDIETFIYCMDGQIKVDFVRHGIQKDQVISLELDMFVTLYHIIAMVNTSVRKSMAFTYKLGELVAVSHEQFRSRWSVNIRQSYINDRGEVAPGRYGINIAIDDWRRACRSTMKEMCKY